MTGEPVRIDLSGENCDPIAEVLRAIDGAKASVSAVVYKFNVEEIGDALRTAMGSNRNKVAVRLLVDQFQVDEREKDESAKRAASKRKKERPMVAKKLEDSCARTIAAHGATVRKWTKGKLHAKFVIVDGRIVLSGSYNWTKSALSRNTELMLRFDDREIAGRFEQLFETLWSSADELDAYGGAIHAGDAGNPPSPRL